MKVSFGGGHLNPPRVIRRRTDDASLVIRGGLIVDPSGDLVRLDVAVESVHVGDLAPSIETRCSAIEAAGQIVVPGLVHPWFDPQGTSSSFDLAKQLRATLHFGITTVHLPNVGVGLGRAIRQAIAEEIVDGPRILLSKALREAQSAESPLTELRRSVGFGVDLLVSDGEDPELEKIARSVAEMARRAFAHGPDLQSASARSSDLFERLFVEASSDRSWATVAQESLASARALGMGDTIGSIETGKLADMTIINAEEDGWRPAMILTTSSG